MQAEESFKECMKVVKECEKKLKKDSAFFTPTDAFHLGQAQNVRAREEENIEKRSL